MIDRFSTGSCFNSKQGVGLARKIGADAAVQCIQKGKIKSPWIFCTDADASLPKNYFHIEEHLQHKTSYFTKNTAAIAGVYGFEHTVSEPASKLSQSIKIYESYIRSTYKNLQAINSPYAFPAIGSLIFFDVHAYCKVRGFPNRQAGEDFYILNKLAKIGSIAVLQKPVVKILARYSNRTPFGTGQALETLQDSPMQPSYEVNQCHFQLLKIIFDIIEAHLMENNNGKHLTLDNLVNKINLDNFLNQNEKKIFFNTLKRIKISSIIENSYLSSDQAGKRIKNFHVAFDGLKTYQFINAFRKSSRAEQVMIL